MDWKEVLKNDEIEKGIIDKIKGVLQTLRNNVSFNRELAFMQKALDQLPTGGNILIQRDPAFTGTTKFDNNVLMLGSDIPSSGVNMLMQEFMKISRDPKTGNSITVDRKDSSGIDTVTLTKLGRDLDY